jgi:beta-galactosidase/beta-glucuronidase
VFVLRCLFVTLSQAAERTSLDLDGTWQYQKVSELSYPSPANWVSVSVPGYVSGSSYAKAWFRRSVTLPGSGDQQRIKRRFGGVSYNSTVRVNGQVVGGCINGYNPFVLDITAAALPGQANKILVGLSDWTGWFAAPVDFSNLAPGEG